jgi:hypothetical protein
MFLIFGGTQYYSNGGVNDLIENHNDKSCAIQRAIELLGMNATTRKAKPENSDWDDDETHEIEWTQVYSVESMEVVYKSKSKPYGESDGIISVQ